MAGRDHDDDLLGPLRRLDSRADERFADRLEAELRVGHAAARRPAPPVWRRLAVLAPALTLLVVVATTTLVLRDDTRSAALEISDANGVVVTLPDGTEVADPADGFALPDGAMVTVSPGGSATIDSVTLGAGAVVTVRDGSLVTDVVGTTTTAVTTSSAPPVTEPTTVDPPPSSTGPATTAPLPSTSTTRPDVTPTSVTPTPTRPVDEVEPPVDTRVEPTPETTVEPVDAGVDQPELALRLRVRPGDKGVMVVWRAEGVGERPWRTVLLRHRGRGEPAWPVVRGTSELASTDGDTPGDYLDTDVGGDLPLRYRIVVVDAADGLVAQSAVQTVAVG